MSTITFVEEYKISDEIAWSSNLRHASLEDDVAWDWKSLRGLRSPSDGLALLLACPRIKTITLVIDIMPPMKTPVRDVLEYDGCGLVDLHCVKIGLFKANITPAFLSTLTKAPARMPEIFLKNKVLHDNLPHARELVPKPILPDCKFPTHDYDGPIDEAGGIAHWLWGYELMTRFRFHSLARGLLVMELDTAIHFDDEVLQVYDAVPWRSSLMKGSAPRVQDLAPKKHGPELLEWATDLLAMNVEEAIGWYCYE